MSHDQSPIAPTGTIVPIQDHPSRRHRSSWSLLDAASQQAVNHSEQLPTIHPGQAHVAKACRNLEQTYRLERRCFL